MNQTYSAHPADPAEGPPDGELFASWCAGDAAAFDALYDRWSGPTWRFLVHQCGSHRAEEMHQEAWLQVVRNREKYREDHRFAGWLFTLIRNLVIDDARRRKVRPDQDHAGTDPDRLTVTIDAVGTIDRQRAADRLRTLVNALPFEQREVVLLRWEAGMSLPEIAELTGVSRDTAKSRLRYALDKLREELQDDAS